MSNNGGKTEILMLTLHPNGNLEVKRTAKNLVTVFGMMECAKMILMKEPVTTLQPPTQEDIEQLVRQQELRKG